MPMELLESEFFGNSAKLWLTAGIVFSLLLVALVVLRLALLKRLQWKAKLTPGIWDDVVVVLLERTQFWLPLLVSLRVATHFLTLPPKVDRPLDLLFSFGLLLQIGLWLNHALSFLGETYSNRALEKDAGRATTVRALVLIAKIALWVLVSLLLLDNWGVKVAPFVAGLGIGGVAIALAVQNILGDLFASLSIVLDKPFVIGDSIAVGTESGTVERIGLKTTRVRSVTGEQLIFSNSDLLQSRVRNFKRMEERRVELNFGVTYETSSQNLSRIRTIVTEILAGIQGVRLDHCFLHQLGASSLDFRTIFWIQSGDYRLFTEKYHEAALALIERFRKEGIDFAYPTQTVYQHNLNETKQ